MARALTAMLAIQSKAGLVFGQMVQWTRAQMVFEVAMELETNVEFEFRVEMAGLDDTVLGRLRVLARAPTVDGVARHSARIEWVHPEDQGIYDDWAEAFEAGRPPSSLHGLANQSGFATGKIRGTSAEERARVSKEMEDRLKQRQGRAREVLLATKKVWPDPFDEAGARVAAAIGFVDSLAFRNGPTDLPAVVAAPPPVNAPVVAAPPPPVVAPAPPVVAAPPPVVAARPPPAVPAPPPCSVTIDRSKAVPKVVFTWSGVEGFRADARAHLRHGLMHVDSADVGPVGSPVEVVLVTPEGHEIPCVGRIAIVHPLFTGLELGLGAGMCAAFAVM